MYFTFSPGCTFICAQVGIHKGFNVGLGNGGLFCACFFTYALGFWYGGQLVADSVEHGCSGDGCVNGGKTLRLFVLGIARDVHLACQGWIVKCAGPKISTITEFRLRWHVFCRFLSLFRRHLQLSCFRCV
jgi:hypothetical protein